MENPSIIVVEHVKLKVAHGNYDVYEYKGNNTKEPLAAEVVCLERFLENGTFIEDCDMHIKIVVPYSTVVLLLEYNPLTDLRLPEEAEGIASVESMYEKYTYLGPSDEGIVFKLEKYNETYYVGFDLREYYAD